MGLQLLDRDLGVIDHALTVGGLMLGTRTTVIRRTDGSVILISPGPLDDAAAAAIAALGPVRAIVAPNLMHHRFVAAARARFAEARLYAPLALAHKAPALRIDGAPAEVAAIVDDTLHAVEVGGMPKLEETLLVHAPSRTLVATDLVFNLRAPAPWFTRTFMRLNGGFDRFGPTRLCRSMCKDRAAVRAAVERVLDEPFDRVIVAHGQVLPSGGRPALRAGFAWLLEEARAAA
jgi:glyoxylase-like metal-dependent hydrolase (beta-lactamase superfamily II)